MPRKRKDPRGDAARTALIEAAEELFAEHGVNGVSLRQIGDAIGSDNNAVVSYYFGSKAGLLQAIYEHRVPALELRRSELLRRADAGGAGEDALTLFYAMWAPIFEQRNARGKPSYAGFLASVGHSELISMRALSQSYPSTREISDRLRRASGMSEEAFWRRLKLVSMLMIEAIQDAVQLQVEGLAAREVETMFTTALSMAKAAFCAGEVDAEALRRLKQEPAEPRVSVMD
jgi:AcrR family transcriptional regulator